MNRLKQAAILLTIAEKLRSKGSWCGETHLQKSTYFLQELLNLPTEFGFILYKHGPFSFDLRDALTAMRADQLLDLQPQQPYGPSLAPTEQGTTLQKLYPKTIHKYEKAIDFVADKLASKSVFELERLATALYVTLQVRTDSVRRRASGIHKLKPHVSVDDAKLAVRSVDSIIEEAERRRLQPS